MGDEGRDGRAWAAAAGLAGVLLMPACGRPAPATSTGASGREAADAGFLAPPTLAGAAWTSGGGVRLTGRAPRDAVVRLQSPDGRALGVTADAAGAWIAELPRAAAPELFALSADLGGRILRGEGALAVSPPGGASPVLLARAGASSSATDSAPPPAAPLLVAVDFDAGGGIAAAGRAAPAAALKLRIDGADAGAGSADASGRFALPGVGPPLTPGPHRIRVEAAAGAAEADVDTAPAPPLDGAPYRTSRITKAWRVDWAPPGGGVQSLVWLDAHPAAPPGRSR